MVTNFLRFLHDPPTEKSDDDDIPEPERFEMDYISLTTHEGHYGSNPVAMDWGNPDPMKRGPVIATVKHGGQRNAIGAHGGGYCVYTALAVAAGELNPGHIPNLKTTQPTDEFGPFKTWKDPKALVTIDPWGHMVTSCFEPYFNKGYDIRPTIAVTKAHIDFPEVKDALRLGRIKADGHILKEDGQSLVTKAAIEPVWYLPGVAERFGCTEAVLRQALFKETNMMYPELLTRTDIKLFLPPIGGLTIYMWGDPATIPDESIPLTVRVHDECNGSDVFGSDICTCRPYLAHAIEECIRTAQNGGCGVCIYYRKEGRSLGEVTKYLVYNMRKRAEGGDKVSWVGLSWVGYVSFTERGGEGRGGEGRGGDSHCQGHRPTRSCAVALSSSLAPLTSHHITSHRIISSNPIPTHSSQNRPLNISTALATSPASPTLASKP